MATPVSILIPCYNAERYVAEAMESVLAQTHRDFELLAINDGSTDRTGEILERYAKQDSRVRIISHANMGMGRSLNKAIELASHDWLARMDADDVMLPDRLERQLAFVAERPELVVVSSLVVYIDSESKEIGRSFSNYTRTEQVEAGVKSGELIGFHHPAVLMRREVVREVGGYRHQFWPADDADLWNRITERYPRGVLVQAEYLLKYRIHASSVCVSAAALTAQKADWVSDCMARRRSGRPELTWEQYLAELNSKPWLIRLNRKRRDYARALYKAAAHHFSSKRYGSFIPAMAGAAALSPGTILKRFVPKRRLGGAR
jgi:glycosyltransferase involved in cell wall biosynthesis